MIGEKYVIHVSPRITTIVLLIVFDDMPVRALLFTMIASFSTLIQSHISNCPTFKLSPVLTIISIFPKPSLLNPRCLCAASLHHTAVDIRWCEQLPSHHGHQHLRIPAAQRVDRRTCAVSTVGKILQIDRLSAGVLWSNLPLNLALSFLLGCQVNMSDMGKETFGEVWNAPSEGLRWRDVEHKWLQTAL